MVAAVLDGPGPFPTEPCGDARMFSYCARMFSYFGFSSEISGPGSLTSARCKSGFLASVQPDFCTNGELRVVAFQRCKNQEERSPGSHFPNAPKMRQREPEMRQQARNTR